jgi:hypothetical protein
MPPILAIDPGPEESAWVHLDEERHVLACAKEENALVLEAIRHRLIRPIGTHVAIERVKARGMRLGDDTLQTCEWVGRFQQHAGGEAPWVHLCYRPIVAHWVTQGAPSANDAVIRHCLLNLYGPGRAKAVGTKKHPGPLYGVTRDVWQALAVALYVHYFLRHGRPYTDMSHIMREETPR